MCFNIYDKQYLNIKKKFFILLIYANIFKEKLKIIRTRIQTISSEIVNVFFYNLTVGGHSIFFNLVYLSALKPSEYKKMRLLI